jgi:signal transduction histidine kinase/ligand-binding sensor domain-containing protein
VRLPLMLRATLCLIVLACCPCAFALNPSLDVGQYAHTAWRARDGFIPGAILAIAQTPDGYLWLGTEFGLDHFDGVHFVPWQPPAGQYLPSQSIHSLLVARDGTLWIGTTKGVASWKNGKLTRYPDLDGQMSYSLLEDRQGTIWSASEPDFAAPSICAVEKSGVHCYGKDGSLAAGGLIVSLYEDREGDLWAVAGSGIWKWKPGPPKFYPLSIGSDYLDGIAEDDAGGLLIGMKGGIRRFSDGKTGAYPLPAGAQAVPTRTLLWDNDDALWIAVYHAGLVHIHRGRADFFRQADGLSSDEVLALFQDHENNLWVSTQDGLDRFRDTAVATFFANQGLSSGLARSVLADKDGSVWVATPGGLDRWRDGQITSYDKRDGKLNGLSPTSLFQDSSGRVWVSTSRELGYLKDNRFVSVTGTDAGRMLDFAEDTAGNLWIADQQGGLLHLSGGKLVEQIPWVRLGHKDFALSLAADHSRGGLWLGFAQGDVSYFADGQIRKTYTTADGLGAGSVNSLQMDKGGELWAATDSGLSRMKNGQFATLALRNGLPCSQIDWMLQDDDHSLWLYTPCGLVRLSRSDMDAWAGAADDNQAANHMVHPTIFDSWDGVRVHEISYHGFYPPATKSLDGKIWFLPQDGVSVIDPHHLPYNEVPPPVHIEQITADGKAYDGSSGLRLPPAIRDLTIDYTALSLAVPERVRFRYKLEGQDPDWKEAVNGRQVHYSNLAPKNYRFRVIASNNSGVWNEQGASLDFSIAPAYYQTAWFGVLCMAIFLSLLWALYLFRLRQIRLQFNAGLEASVDERTRIARELHDTLLQSLHGLMFQFQAARNILPQRPENEKVMQALDDAILGTESAITESRDAIRDLRPQPVAESDLAQLLTASGRELAVLHDGRGDSPLFRVIVEGESKALSPNLQDEVYRIVREVIRNAFRHSGARQIEVEIRYATNELRLRVRDDGKGMNPRAVEERRRTGHWGLPGIRERVQRIGSRLDLWTEAGAGTEIQLTVPGAIAYQAARDGSRFKLFRKARTRE